MSIVWLAWLGCSGEPEEAMPTAPEPIVIGVLAPYGSGPGEGIRHGVEQAVGDLGGTIAGRPVVVEERDTAWSVDQTVRGFGQLAGAEDAVAVIGVAGDGVFALMEQLESYETPLLCTGTGADRLTAMVAEDPSRYRWFFRVMHRSSELAEVTSAFARDFLHAKHGVSRFGVLVEQAVWTDQIRSSWRQVIDETEGMELVFDESFGSETRDFQPLLTKLKDSGAEYVLDASSKVEATHYLKQWAALEGPPIGAIPTGAGTQRYYDELGARGLAVSSVSTIPSEANQATERSAAWWNAYQERWGDPEYTSAYSYDATMLLAAALEKTGGEGGDGLVQALEATDHAGVAGRWVFGADHQGRYGTGYREIPVVQYFEEGARGYRIVWPESRAAGEMVWPVWWAK